MSDEQPEEEIPTDSEGPAETELDEAGEDVAKNFREMEDDPLERAQKEGGEEAEFDLESQIQEFRQQIEEEPDQPIHHYNLAEALEETGEFKDAQIEYQLALELDKEKDFHAVIHYGLGNLLCHLLLSGIQSVVVKSSVGLHSAHKPGDQITQVYEEDYQVPLNHFEKALESLPNLKADEDLVDEISREIPGQMANLYYKWGSDLIDKSRQITLYGEEKKDVKEAIRLLKKSLEIDANHQQANLMVKYARKMLAEGWQAYDEYGFEAKKIDGEG